MALAPSSATNAFFSDLRIADQAVRTGVVPGTAAKADRHWTLWEQFCQELHLQPLLPNHPDPVSCLQVFAVRYRRRLGPTGDPVRSTTVADALRSIGQTMARMGATDLRLASNGKLDFRLARQLRSYSRQDPPPHRVKPIPIVIVKQVAISAAASGAPADLAIADMIILAFFFLLRPGEYTGTNNDDTPFRLCDVVLTRGQQHANLFWDTDAQLLASTGISLTFTTQKNGVRGEVVHHGRSGHPTLCPVLSGARRIIHLRTRDAAPDAVLAAYCLQDRFKLVTTKDITAALKAATAIHGPAYNFSPSDVSARSLRAGGAMALFNCGVDSNTIRLLGRWQSDAMLRYLHLQAQPVMRGFAARMLRGGDYGFAPKQAIPDLHHVPMH